MADPPHLAPFAALAAVGCFDWYHLGFTTGVHAYTTAQGPMAPRNRANKEPADFNKSLVASMVQHTEPVWNSSPIKMPGWFNKLRKDVATADPAYCTTLVSHYRPKYAYAYRWQRERRCGTALCMQRECVYAC